jgi:DNA (cytosine-5)-methyltransferase 3A
MTEQRNTRHTAAIAQGVRMRQITVLSLFDGISCARVALDRLGYTDVLYLASEVDKYASAITRHQWPDTIHLGDITQIKRENLPVQIDLLIGGSPCQDLSIAKNNRKGLDGERSGLFWEWVRLWQECKPTWWVLENVNSMPKEAKRIISETLGVEPIMINAALVSAQNRKRLFWTNIETDMFGNCHIPQPEDRGILLKHILESGTGCNYNRIDGVGEAIEKSRTLNSSDWRSIERNQPQTAVRDDKENIKSPDQRKKAVTNALEGYTIRKLTPVECERLMTLPDHYTALGDFGDGEAKPVSNTQRYKTLGNGFVVEVVAHILSFMEEP